MDRPSRNQSPPPRQEEESDVIVLCGGLGTRLRPAVSDRPKVLADIGGRPFLDILLDWLRAQGFSRFILCVGYQGQLVKDHFKGKGEPMLFSEEEVPLGTGGALKKAWPLIQSSRAIVMNGDTYCPVLLRELLDFHTQKQALMTMALTRAVRADGGGIALGDSGQILGFKEKTGEKSEKYMNAGTYILEKKAGALLPKESVFSLEYDWFPSLIKISPCFGFITKETVIDIGTPERYLGAVRRLSS